MLSHHIKSNQFNSDTGPCKDKTFHIKIVKQSNKCQQLQYLVVIVIRLILYAQHAYNSCVAFCTTFYYVRVTAPTRSQTLILALPLSLVLYFLTTARNSSSGVTTSAKLAAILTLRLSPHHVTDCRNLTTANQTGSVAQRLCFVTNFQVCPLVEVSSTFLKKVTKEWMTFPLNNSIKSALCLLFSRDHSPNCFIVCIL